MVYFIAKGRCFICAWIHHRTSETKPKLPQPASSKARRLPIKMREKYPSVKSGNWLYIEMNYWHLMYVVLQIRHNILFMLGLRSPGLQNTSSYINVKRRYNVMNMTGFRAINNNVIKFMFHQQSLVLNRSASIMAAVALLHHTGVFLSFALKCLVEGGRLNKHISTFCLSILP